MKTNINFGDISLDVFMREFWQKKPILIKGGFSNFKDIISADELAGLAEEEFIESRLVYKDKGKWQAELGPFDNYERLGETDWTLVVQSTNHWKQELEEFAKNFHFIPQWRFDDVMISFGTTGGGVGPHIDNYDVFICQGSGTRNWRVGAKEGQEEFAAHEKLLHVHPFDAIIDEIVSAGDILYIPPGFPHEGISLEPSMSFSVGYKTTNENELISGFADYLLEYNSKPKLLVDKNRETSEKYGKINNNDLKTITDFLQESLADKELITKFVAEYYSSPFHELDICETSYSQQEWLNLFKENKLTRIGGLKVLYTEQSLVTGKFYVNGEEISLANKNQIELICNQQELDFKDIDSSDEQVLTTLLELTNKGFWYF